MRIQNLLETRKYLEQKFGNKIISIKFDDQNYTPADKEFLNRLKDAILQNINNSDFGIKDLADKSFLSERQMRRKINELTQLSPLEFVRQVRLFKAKEIAGK